MKMKFFLLSFTVCIFLAASTHAQFRKMDTTLKAGKAGYHVLCNNKNADKNEMTIKPIGFENTAHPMGFYIKGRAIKADIDDMNNDGFPDLLVYIFSGENSEFGTVYVFMSVENKSVSAAMLPDAMLDGKIKDGYKGQDEFSLLEGKLIRKFPIYKAGDEKDKPTGGTRIIQYQVAGSGDAGFKFVMLRYFDSKS